VCSSAFYYLSRPARQLFARELCARERSRQAHSLHTYFAAHIGLLLTTPGDLSAAPKVTGIVPVEPSTTTGELDATMILELREQRCQKHQINTPELPTYCKGHVVGTVKAIQVIWRYQRLRVDI
jgi:hypothetical protein